MSPAPTAPYRLEPRSIDWQLARGAELAAEMDHRRSCRYFSDAPLDRRVLEHALAIGNSAPSGANRKPWRFVAIDDPAIKREIRVAAEAEEKESYEHRMPPAWLAALEPLGTDWRKPFLEIAPWLVVIFRVDFQMVDGQKHKSYYPNESTGLAAGFFLMACHQLGLATLTHTPSPMNFLREICRRPDNERPFLLVPVGYPAADCTVPDVRRAPLAERVQWNRPKED